MYNLRDELINTCIKSLKIDDNTFNRQIILEKLEHIQDNELQKFYSDLFHESHRFLSGMDRIAKVAEQFKPQILEDDTTKEAKRLISGVEAMNTILFDEAHKRGIMFEDLVRDYKFENVTERSMTILNNVKPYCDIKQLVINIRRYQTSNDALNAFKSAIKQYSNNDNLAIARDVRKMIKGWEYEQDRFI